MKKTVQLVEELRTEASGAEIAALIVVFESTTLYVFANDEDPLSVLDEMVELGGRPIGLFRVSWESGRKALKVRPLTEYVDDPQIAIFLKQLTTNILKQL